MRFLLVTLTLGVLSGTASAAVVPGTFADDTHEEASRNGFAFTAAFYYDAATVERTMVDGPLFMQHCASDVNADGSTGFIEFFFLGYETGLAGVVSPPASVLEGFDVSIPGIPYCPAPVVTGNFRYLYPASSDFDSHALSGQLAAFGISIERLPPTVVPLPATGRLLPGAPGIAGALPTRRMEYGPIELSRHINPAPLVESHDARRHARRI